MAKARTGEHAGGVRKTTCKNLEGSKSRQEKEVQFDPLFIENQEMHSATLNEVSLDYQNRTLAQWRTGKSVVE